MRTVDIIQEILDSKNIKPSKMAADLGFSSGLFSQWKSGKQKVSLEKIVNIADYFDCSVDYLLGRTDNSNSISNGNISNSSVAQASGSNNCISIQSKNEHPYAEIIEHLDSLSSPAERRHAIADLMDVLESKYPIKKK